MTRFLTYFDLLDYNNFIEKNTVGYLDYRTAHFARNMALLDGKRKERRNSASYISDISQLNINSSSVYDTVVFVTNGNCYQDFIISAITADE